MVYTNLSSEVHLKSLIDCPLGSFIDSGSITDDINIVTNVITFRESGMNKTIKNERIFGDSVVTSITRPTQLELDLTFSIDEDVGAIGSSTYDILTSMGDYENLGSYNVYTEDDSKRRHRIALVWNDSTESYMKVYYNAYVQNINISNDKALEANMKMVIPIVDIHTGSPNYYEYEGVETGSILDELDTLMEWS